MQQMEAAQRSHEEELKRQQAETERFVGGGRTEASAEDGGDDEAA
jgi:hypothetical protein